MQPDIVKWLNKYDHEAWTNDLRECVRTAIAEIEYLRSLTGPVSRGGDIADIAAGVMAAKPKLPEVG